MHLPKVISAVALLANTVLGKEEAAVHRLQRYHNHNIAEAASIETTTTSTSTMTEENSTPDPTTSSSASSFDTSLATAIPANTRHRKHKGHKPTISYSSLASITSSGYTNTSTLTANSVSSTITLAGCSAPSTSVSTITIVQNVTSTILPPSSNTTTLSSISTTTTSFTTTTSPSSSPSPSSTTPSSSTTAPPLTSVIPATIATLPSSELHPSTSVIATTIMSGTPVGSTANPKALHCGLHGLPIGDYFLAGFNENETSGRLDLWKCWRYCTSVFGTDMGCQSYTFYPEEGTDAPRCDLFGGSVAQSLDSVNRWVPNVWFDLGCGAPPRG